MIWHKWMDAVKAAVRAVRGVLHTYREEIRSVLLVLLAAGVVVQSGQLWSRVLTRESIPWDGLRTRLAAQKQEEQNTDNSAGALPIRFAARGADGLYGIQYNTEGLKMAYEQTADVWAQACENAAEPVVIDAGEYRELLRQQMMMMEYDGRIPLDIAAGWMGASVSEQMTGCTVGTAVLCRREDGSYALCLRDSGDGSLRRARTSVDDSMFDTAVRQFEANDCTIAADGENKAVSPDLLYFPGGEVFHIMSFQSYKGGDGMETLLRAFRMDAEAALTHAYASNGMMVYVSGRSAVHMADDGSLRYDGVSVRLPASHGRDRLLQCVQTGYELTGAALEAIDSGASPALTRAYTDKKSGRYVVVYGIQVGGVPVDNEVTGYFARYEFEGDTMVHANLALRTCQTSGETVAVMPEKQAAASLKSTLDAVLSLRYVDKAVGTNSSWEQLYSAENSPNSLWDAENEEAADPDAAWSEESAPDEDGDGIPDDPAAAEDGWNDIPAGEEDNSVSGSAQVAPQWYVLHYDGEKTMPDFGKTLSPEEIVVIRPDFDRMIQGGAAK